MKSVRKGDTVIILSGKDKGKKGQIIAVSPKKGKVKVKGLNLIMRHMKARKQGETPGIKKLEAFIDCSNVMAFDSTVGKPVRVNKLKR